MSNVPAQRTCAERSLVAPFAGKEVGKWEDLILLISGAGTRNALS